jgi:hypothetical protein
VDSPAEGKLRREYAADKWRKIITWLSFSFALFSLLFSGYNGAGLLAMTTFGVTNNPVLRLVFFIPRTSLSIRDLDQAVALAAGMITLMFSIYDAIKSLFARETEDFERWKRSRSGLTE